jgi:ABC-2 type transport system permease protein
VTLLLYSLAKLDAFPHITILQVSMYLAYSVLGVAFFYSLMIALASTSSWFGRNQGLYEFWCSITIFARYPRSIYDGSSGFGMALQSVFSYAVPILLVVTVPAQVLLDKTLSPSWLTLVLAASAVLGLLLSRVVFHRALMSYRSASS